LHNLDRIVDIFDFGKPKVTPKRIISKPLSSPVVAINELLGPIALRNVRNQRWRRLTPRRAG
jgi:hypothetical protein